MGDYRSCTHNLPFPLLTPPIQLLRNGIPLFLPAEKSETLCFKKWFCNNKNV